MQPEPKKKVPAAVMVIAILNFIFGGLGLCGGVFAISGANQMMLNANPKQAQIQKTLEDEIEKKVPNYKSVEMGINIFNAFLSLCLIILGIGLLKLQSWGRYGCLAYGGIDILAVIASVIFQFAFVVPASKDAISSIPEFQRNKAARDIMETTLTFAPAAGCCGGIYPIAVLIVMFLPSVTRAFSGEPPKGYGDDDYGDFQRDPYPSDGYPPNQGGYPPSGGNPPDQGGYPPQQGY